MITLRAGLRSACCNIAGRGGWYQEEEDKNKDEGTAKLCNKVNEIKRSLLTNRSPEREQMTMWQLQLSGEDCAQEEKHAFKCQFIS